MHERILQFPVGADGDLVAVVVDVRRSDPLGGRGIVLLRRNAVLCGGGGRR